ncbi:MAG: CapA family protein, partial [Anaeromyxobacteraceae bacterium]
PERSAAGAESKGAGAESKGPQPESKALHPLSSAPPSVKTLARARLAAVGDVLMHSAVKDAAADHRGAGDGGFGWLWAPIADLLSAPDLTFANLETPIAPRAGAGSRSFVFNAPPDVVRALARAGVDLVSVANNHMLDQGRAGFEETLRELDAAGMPYVGAGEAGREAGPRVVTVNGLRLAFLGYTYGLNQSGNDCPAAPRPRPCVRASVLDRERAVLDVRAAADAADAVVVSVHWGEEYQQQPREADVALAHQLADAGALVVLGHHPHVLQPLELYSRADGRTALIVYSLGNFVSNQSRLYVHGVTPERVGATRDGALVELEIARRDYGRGVVRVELAAAGWTPLWTENDTADPDRRARRGARPSIQVVSLDRALAQVRSELAALPDPVPPEAQSRYVKLRRREELYLARRAAITAVMGEDLEREAPPVAAAPAAPGEPAAAAVAR